MAGVNIKQAALNFKNKLRETERAAKEAITVAKGLRGISGSQELSWAADAVLQAVEKANKDLDRVLRY